MKILFAMVVVIPVVTAILIGILALRGTKLPERLAYRCRRCGGGFKRPAHRGFPTSCPRCHATDWNA